MFLILKMIVHTCNIQIRFNLSTIHHKNTNHHNKKCTRLSIFFHHKTFLKNLILFFITNSFEFSPYRNRDCIPENRTWMTNTLNLAWIWILASRYREKPAFLGEAPISKREEWREGREGKLPSHHRVGTRFEVRIRWETTFAESGRVSTRRRVRQGRFGIETESDEWTRVSRWR